MLRASAAKPRNPAPARRPRRMIRGGCVLPHPPQNHGSYVRYRTAPAEISAHSRETLESRCPAPHLPQRKATSMNINLALAPLVSLLAGILILIMPRLLNYIVALYLIVIGLIGLFGAGNLRL